MLPKSKRLKRADFSKAYKRTVIRGNFLDASVSPADSSRFACVVAKKRVKLAVDRNTVKRKIYGALSETTLLKPYTVIIYPKQNILKAPFSKIKEELQGIFDTL